MTRTRSSKKPAASKLKRRGRPLKEKPVPKPTPAPRRRWRTTIRQSVNQLLKQLKTAAHVANEEDEEEDADDPAPNLPGLLFHRLLEKEGDALGWITLKGALEAIWTSKNGAEMVVRDDLLQRIDDNIRVLDLLLKVLNRVWRAEEQELNGEHDWLLLGDSGAALTIYPHVQQKSWRYMKNGSKPSLGHWRRRDHRLRRTDEASESAWRKWPSLALTPPLCTSGIQRNYSGQPPSPTSNATGSRRASLEDHSGKGGDSKRRKPAVSPTYTSSSDDDTLDVTSIGRRGKGQKGKERVDDQEEDQLESDSDGESGAVAINAPPSQRRGRASSSRLSTGATQTRARAAKKR